ncbi:MAG TPA: DUF1983 domain-containing protein [Pseudomonas sp.]|nr:DUF1983 domain-containing protein [Pseudomonas sp.]HKS12748.1 DUF1983 domain-containing protein [Pseudomonas sp.]
MEGDSSGLAGATGALVGVWTEQSARVEDGIATGRRVDGVQAEVGDVRSTVQTVSESVASLASSTAESIQTVQSSIALNVASTQQVSQTVATLDGKVNAQVTISAQTLSNGRKVMAGLALGSNGETSEILAFAQRFAIMDETSGQLVLPFVVQGGQVFMNTAIINKAFIQEIVAAMSIKSAAVNAQGLPLLEINFAAGTFTLRGQDASGSTLLNNGGLYVYDASGIERTAVGKLN